MTLERNLPKKKKSIITPGKPKAKYTSATIFPPRPQVEPKPNSRKVLNPATYIKSKGIPSVFETNVPAKGTKLRNEDIMVIP